MDQLKNSTPPKAQIKPRELHAHGHKRSDDYYWLNERENPEVIEYLRKENEYTSAMMEDTQILQENIYREIIGRIKQTDITRVTRKAANILSIAERRKPLRMPRK